MKKQNRMIAIGVIVLIILGIVFAMTLLKKEELPKKEENKSEQYLTKSYLFNLNFTTEEEYENIEGSYKIENNTLTYEVEEISKNIYVNPYKELYSMLKSSNLNQKKYVVTISTEQIKRILSFATLPAVTGNYECTYFVEEGMIYSVECRQPTDYFIFDFDFE